MYCTPPSEAQNLTFVRPPMIEWPLPTFHMRERSSIPQLRLHTLLTCVVKSSSLLVRTYIMLDNAIPASPSSPQLQFSIPLRPSLVRSGGGGLVPSRKEKKRLRGYQEGVESGYRFRPKRVPAVAEREKPEEERSSTLKNAVLFPSPPSSL